MGSESILRKLDSDPIYTPIYTEGRSPDGAQRHPGAVVQVAPTSPHFAIARRKTRVNALMTQCELQEAKACYFALRMSLYRATTAGGVWLMRLITRSISSPERGLISSCICVASRR